MDRNFPLDPDDNDIELRLKARAVAEARADKSPGSPQSEQVIIMQKMIDELDQEIAALLAE